MLNFREIHPEDREPIRRILIETNHFTENEVGTALELIDAVIEKTDSGYCIVVAEETEKTVVGYGCWGPVPLTSGTFDIYWIAVSPDCQGKGVGSQILSYMEDQMKSSEGRLILIETSSSGLYQDTRAFYERRGYGLESRIRDFYKPGDDRCIYAKRIDAFG
ncbi:GNAT family N-acetyltransferase [bacterium]|nr:GNAT family N-acetyltransferase [bacterium]